MIYDMIYLTEIG